MRFLFLKLPLVTLPFMLQHKQRNVRCYLSEVPRQISTHVCLQPQPVSEVPRLLRPLHMSLVTETNFAFGSYEKFQPGFGDELKANDPGDEFWHEDPGWKKPRSREPSQPALSYEHIEVKVTRDLGNRAHMKRTLKKFDLLLRVFLHVLKSKKIATQGRTRTFRILISLPYHYTTTPTRQNSEQFESIQ